MFWIFFPHHTLSSFARSHTVLQCGLKTNKRINIRCSLSMWQERRKGGKKTKLLAVDLGGKSFRGENDFLKEQKINSSPNHLSLCMF
jgi:hypothetical protein